MAAVRRTSRYVDDLHAIWAYIARDNAAAADRVVRQIESTAARLATYPELGERQPALGPGVRRIVLGSYLLFYETDRDAVIVLRALHASRRIEDLSAE